MGKHTPGPWHAFLRPNTKTFAVFGPENDPRKPVVEWMGFDATITGLGANTVEANARLIAAAPRMKSALEQAITSMLDSGYSVNSVAVRECQYALADARGENHDE